MQYRMTSRRRKPRGNTVPQQGDKQARTPRMPHESDESADSQQADEPSQARMARAAQEDIERGVVDTDKGPSLHETYERVRDDPEKKFSP
jgi:hypothetical protein